MRLFLLVTCLSCCAASLVRADVAITRSGRGWEITNGQVRLALARSPQGLQVESLRRKDGAEWVAPGSPLCPFLQDTNEKYRYFEDGITDTTKGGKQLTLRFKSDAGGRLSLMLRVYPMGAVIEFAAELENQGQHPLPLLSRIDPLHLSLKIPAGGLKPYSSMRGDTDSIWPEISPPRVSFPTGSFW